MCGFVGVIKAAGMPERAILDAARDRLAHRGPDDAGAYAEANVYLGFRRLAILDLAPAANQPMESGNRECVIVFNGEIYNYVELREELKGRGFRFHTETDTEVLLALYQERGTEMFRSLNGMFALAIYDRARGRILLARDRLGKKPLFFCVEAGSFCFASELKALRGLPGFPSSIDGDAANLYFRLGWVPNSNCIFRGVRKLPPATWLSYDMRRGDVSEPLAYWSLPEPETTDATEGEWLDRIDALLSDATRIRLRADVPVGTFLSGGIDSGLVTFAASKWSGPPISAVTIAFPGRQEDESELATRTARHLGVRSSVRSVDGLRSGISESVLSHFDEPFADSSAHPTSEVCAAARESVTVALSGDGGDELFAGYAHYLKAQRFRFLNRIPLALRRAVSAAGVAVTRSEGRSRRILRRLGEDVAIWGAGCTLDPLATTLDRYLRPEMQDLRPVYALPAKIPGGRPLSPSPLDAAQRFDIRLYMLDDILVKVDRMSMLHSLEVRCPFLDYRIVELALRIPAWLRVRGGQTKYLLRRLAERHLPADVARAPKKGFGVPLREWLLESPSAERFRQILLDRDSRSFQPCLPGAAERLWADAHQREDLVYPLYTVLVFNAWQRGTA